MSEDLRDVPSRGDQAVDRAEYRRLSWEGAKARLERDVRECEGMPVQSVHQLGADIRAALEREAAFEKQNGELRAENWKLRQRVEELEQDLYDARHSLAHCVPGRKAAVAEVERLEGQLNASLLGLNEARSRVLQAEAEVERLRAALKRMPCMQNEGAEFWCKKDGSAHSVYCPVSIARAALRGEK